MAAKGRVDLDLDINNVDHVAAVQKVESGAPPLWTHHSHPGVDEGFAFRIESRSRRMNAVANAG